jgi:putative ABC transport system permease protein
MSGATHWLVRLLLLAYPAELRDRDRATLEAECLACIERERRRLGVAGVLYACVRLAIDAVATGMALRQHLPFPAPKERFMARLWQDIRFAARSMQRAPFFSTIIVVTLALAIGATTAVFTVVNAVLLRALPYKEPDRLVMLYQGIGKPTPMQVGFSAPDYLAFAERVGAFESIAVFRNREYELSGVEPPERVTVTRASPSLFETLGVRPALGRPFTQEDIDNSRRVAVISDALWTRKFSRDPGVLGRAVMLDRQPFEIVAVMPRDFVFPNRGPMINNIPGDVFVPAIFSPRERQGFGSMYNNSVVARLKPGVTADQANADASALVHANAVELYPASLKGLAEVLGASVVPMADEVIGRSKTLLWVAFGAVCFVLLIACTDIASLMLTRAMGREREIAVRAALGAGRGRIVRQLLAEAWVLALAGSALGLVLATWLARVLVTIAPPTLPRLHEIGIDARILAFTAGLTVFTAVLCGLLPALELARPATGDALKEGGRTSTPGKRQRRIFGALVATQVAVAVVLLVAGGLLLRSFSRLMAVDPGFRSQHVLTLSTSLPASGYPQAGNIRGFYTRLIEELSHLPGVQAVGTTTDLPLNVRERRVFTIEGEADATREMSHSVANEWVNGRYFEALGIRLMHGRYFGPQDNQTGEPVAIVNETLARQFWGTADPVGQRLAWGMPDNHAPWMRIVGVVGDVKQGPLNTETVPQVYTAWDQVSDGTMAENVMGIMRSLRIAIRTNVEPSSVAAVVRQQIRGIDPALPVMAVRTMEEVVETSTAVQRFNMLLVGLFALLALLLAAIGIGGVLATSVSRRAPELGVRLALGAQHSTLVAMVVRQGMFLAAIGLAIGLPAAWMLSRLMKALLYDVSPRDPFTFVACGLLLAAVALLACVIPAWRATRVDPLTVLRTE